VDWFSSDAGRADAGANTSRDASVIEWSSCRAHAFDSSGFLGSASTSTGTCGGSGADDVLVFTADTTGSYTFDVAGSFDVVLYLRDGGCRGTQLACRDSGYAGDGESATVSLQSGQSVAVFVDSLSLAEVGSYYSIYVSRY
jgi:pectate lyase